MRAKGEARGARSEERISRPSPFALRPSPLGRRPTLARAVGLALALALALAGCSLGGSSTPTPTPTGVATGGDPTPLPLRGIATPSGDLLKVDTVLLDIAQVYLQEGRPAAEQRARDAGLLGKNNDVRLTLVLTDTDTRPVTDKVQSIGGRVVATNENIVDITVPADTLFTYVGSSGKNFLQELAAFNTVREVRVTPLADPKGLTFPPGATLDQVQEQLALVVSEGVAVTGADKWHAAGITGQGIKVGIIDGGFAGYEGLLGKELPARVTARAFNPDNTLYSDPSEIHGTAVTEIVHGMAPDADLYLAAVNGPTDLTRAVKWLVDEVNVKVISMSLGWDGQTRGDGSGPYCAAVDYARSKGVLFVTAAGNEAEEHYAGTFTDGDGDGWHEFAPGKESLRVRSGGVLKVVLNWDAWSGERVNLDLYVYDEAGNPVASSRNDQGAGRDPVELVAVKTRADAVYQIRVKLAGNPPARPLPLKIITLSPLLELDSPAGSLTVPADAKGALTVGASNWKDDKLESYSSQGPTLDGRRKPDVSGPTRVASASYATQGRTFSGTSAATPHVGGAGALAFGAIPGATADIVQEFLQSHAKDLEEPGPENKTGFGRIDLGDPAQAASFRPTPGAAATSAATAGAAPTRPAANGPALTDSLAAPTTGLPNGGETRYDGGKYRIAPNAPNRAAWATYAPSYTDATVEVTAQFEGGVPAAAGIVFWQTGPDDYYLYAVSSDGFFQIARLQGGRWSSLTPWTRSPAIAAGGPLTLRLEVRGTTLTPSVNGTALGAAQAPAAGAGRVGMLVAGFAQPGAAAAFANFTLVPGP